MTLCLTEQELHWCQRLNVIRGKPGAKAGPQGTPRVFLSCDSPRGPAVAPHAALSTLSKRVIAQTPWPSSRARSPGSCRTTRSTGSRAGAGADTRAEPLSPGWPVPSPVPAVPMAPDGRTALSVLACQRGRAGGSRAGTVRGRAGAASASQRFKQSKRTRAGSPAPGAGILQGPCRGRRWGGVPGVAPSTLCCSPLHLMGTSCTCPSRAGSVRAGSVPHSGS